MKPHPRPPARRPSCALRVRSLLAASLFAGSLTATGTPVAGTAQIVRERAVPLDTAGAVFELGPELRSALGLFTEVEGFRSARLFEGSDGRYVLEIVLRDPPGGLLRERRSLSDGEVAELRARVSAALADRSPSAFTTEGRAGLILTTTALGLGYYGWAVPTALDLEDRGALAAYLLTAGASFLVPYRLTRGRPVSRTQRNAAAWGATRGILYGVVLGDALTGGEEVEPDFGREDEDLVVGLGLVGSVLGGALGYGYGSLPGVDEGRVALRATAGDFALAWGFGTSVALGLYDDEPRCEGDVCSEGDLRRRPAGHLAALALAGAGTWASGRWADARRHTLGNTRGLRSFGLLGAQAVLPLAWAVFEDRNDGERALAATLVLGSAAGLWVGDRLLRERQLSSGGGLLVLAGHVAGGLGALGLTYLVDDTDDPAEVLYMTTSALGSVAGSWLTLRAVGDEDGGAGADGRGPRVELRSLPAGLLSLVVPRGGRRTDRPWITVRF